MEYFLYLSPYPQGMVSDSEIWPEARAMVVDFYDAKNPDCVFLKSVTILSHNTKWILAPTSLFSKIRSHIIFPPKLYIHNMQV